nr:hypothetical protein [Pseudomonas sp. s4]
MIGRNQAVAALAFGTVERTVDALEEGIGIGVIAVLKATVARVAIISELL